MAASKPTSSEALAADAIYRLVDELRSEQATLNGELAVALRELQTTLQAREPERRRLDRPARK